MKKLDIPVAILLGVCVISLAGLAAMRPDTVLPVVLPTIVAFFAAFRGKVLSNDDSDSE